MGESDSNDQEYNHRILEITKELCLQLNIPNYDPTFVSWEELDSRSRSDIEFRYDDCLIEKYCVTLSARMKEVLEPDEWKPIIASSLIFSKRLRNRAIGLIGIGFAALVVFALVLLLVLPIVAILGLIGGGIFLISVIISRRLRSEADRRAAEIVPAGQFLDVLSKISQLMTQWGYQPDRSFRGPISLLPDIQTRIARLKRYSESKT